MSENKCPQCGRYSLEYYPGRNEYRCLWHDCSYVFRDKCKYPNCEHVTNYPDLEYCSIHRDLYNFIKGMKCQI